MRGRRKMCGVEYVYERSRIVVDPRRGSSLGSMLRLRDLCRLLFTSAGHFIMLNA